MIYGYDSNLQNGGIHKMIDYQRDFLQELQIARSSKDVSRQQTIPM